ncbi:MAG: RluA family pseudouridine synthase [Rhodospirillales bacterium]|nr:RluA family pseudouridine synthase [Rhodospirillales bacterium]
MKDENSATTYTVPVPLGKAGCRLDKFLADELRGFSRTRLKVLIDEGRVSTQNRPSQQPPLDPALKVVEGDVFIVQVPKATAALPEAQTIQLNIVYEDDDVIVIDKPAGLVVHPAPGSLDGTLVNALLGHARDSGNGGGLSGIGGVERPGIVHRLDKGTSGLMVVAKNDISHRSLSKQFADRSIERAYFALVWGVPSSTQGEISGNIGRSPSNRKKMAVVKRGGKVALTRFKVVEIFGTVASMVECRLATGRTHQIRVHMASLGHPVIGDPVYGGGRKAGRKGMGESLRIELETLNHQALHAYKLGFLDKNGSEKLYFEIKIPSYFKSLIEKLSTF